jgi:hypothetical protein
VRELDDLGALQILAMENNQRADLHPMEEAELFEAFTKLESLSQPRIAKLVGREPHYIRDRLQLLKLTKEARKLFLENRFTVKHAIILARLEAKDQARAIESDRSGNGQIGGLFISDMSLFDGESDEDDNRKPVSVGEFQHWVDRHVGFDPASPLVAELFPETAEALEEAKVAQQSVVYITYQDYVHPDAKGADRIVTGRHWKRADGLADPHDGDGGKPSKTCDHSVLGVVKAGPSSGLSFEVCVNKKKCLVHWASEARAAAKRAKAAATGDKSGAPKEEPRERQERIHREHQAEIRKEDDRWKKALPQLAAAVSEKIKAAPAGSQGVLGKLLIKEHGRRHGLKIDFPVGTTAEDLVRFLTFSKILGDLDTYWGVERVITESFKPFGIDPKVIVDQVSPKPAPEKKTESKPAKKRAGDVARARKKKAGR